MFPSLAGLHGDGGDSRPEGERFRAHRAVRTLLELLATRSPVVLVVDDLHWADEATAELLAYLVRRPPRGPVVLALAHRPLLPEPLGAALAEAERAGRVESLRPQPLSLAEAGEMLGSADPAALHSESGGNPLYLRELARARAGGGGGVHPANVQSVDEVPAPVSAAIARELAGLSGEALGFARRAAVLGDAFELDAVAETFWPGAGDATSCLDELIHGDLVRPTDVPRSFRFRHPIVRHAVYELSPIGWRLDAHARAAAVLAARGVPAAARARHVELSATRGDEAAVAVLTEAAADASRRAPGDAAYWYAAVLRLVGDDADRRLPVLVPMAQCLAASGRLAEARETLEGVLALLPPEGRTMRTRLVATCAGIDHVLGDHAAATLRLRSSLAELSDKPTPESTALKTQLAANAFFTGDFVTQREWSVAALADATATADVADMAAASALLGCADYMADDVESARENLAEAERLMDQLAPAQVGRHLTSFTWCGICEVYLERFDRALAVFDRCLETSRASGQDFVAALARIGRGLTLTWQGRLREAAEEADTAVETAELLGQAQFLTWALGVRAWVAHQAGDLELAERLGVRAVELGSKAEDPVTVLAHCHLAETRLERGAAPDRARDDVLAAAGGPGLPLIERAFRSRWYELFARAELRAGEIDAAARWAGLASEAAAGLGMPGRSCEALRAGARVSLAREEFVDAARDALAAAGLRGAGRTADRDRPLADPRRARLRGGGRARARDGRARAGARGADAIGGGARPRRGGPGATRARQADAARAGRSAEFRRPRDSQRPRARGGRPGGRGPHEQGDRGGPLPEREDGREPHVADLRKARRDVTPAGRAGGP